MVRLPWMLGVVVLGTLVLGGGGGLHKCSTPGSPGLPEGNRVTSLTLMHQDVPPFNFTESDTPVKLSS